MSGGDRSAADARLVALLASGVTREDAAVQAKVSVRTVYRRLQERDFRGEVADARTAMVGQAVGQLARLSSSAALALEKLLTARSEHVRLLAARAILELGAKLRETEELEGRIAALEDSTQPRATEGRNKWQAA